jgi:hypothetical protein
LYHFQVIIHIKDDPNKQVDLQPYSTIRSTANSLSSKECPWPCYLHKFKCQSYILKPERQLKPLSQQHIQLCHVSPSYIFRIHLGCLYLQRYSRSIVSPIDVHHSSEANEEEGDDYQAEYHRKGQEVRQPIVVVSCEVVELCRGYLSNEALFSEKCVRKRRHVDEAVW